MFFTCIFLISAFIQIYDHFMRPRWGYGILDFMTDKSQVEKYFYRRNKREKSDFLGRGDAISLVYKRLLENPVSSTLGLGIGSVAKT